ncbi:MAG TPA: AgmX/PglI C-terminal domain-containing protein, partial [Myxococcales bacterium]|nr:AgmX/PglI C-terminal domain-containing protein [Myxococcales bacterium]
STGRVDVQVAPQLTLSARYGQAERKAPRSLLATMDVAFASTLGAALLFLALFWLMVRIAPHPDETVTDDLAGNQQRITQYQVKPREKPVEEPPKTPDVSGVQEGAKAREDEGKLGKREVKKKEAAPSRKGTPAVEPDKRESDRRKVMKLGLVAALARMGAGSGAASNVLGPGGLGMGINKAMGGVRAEASGGDTYGVGGLGSRGTGQGGGGTAIGIGGLGTRGSGAGAGGSEDVELGGRGKEETQFVPGRTIVVGGLSRDVIDRIIRRHYNEVKYCYEKELTKDRGLYGKVTVVFVIDGTGKVSDALVQQSTMGSEAVEGCIVSHVRRWAFPAPEGGGTVQVTYPYVFKSSAQ